MPIRRGASLGAPVKFAAKNRKREPLRLKQLLHLAHRVLIFVAALGYIKLSFDSAFAAVGLLRGRSDPLLPTDDSTFDLMAAFVGDTTLLESRLVTYGLRDHTAPQPGTLYLHSRTETSFTMCPSMPAPQRDIYDDPFLRSVYDAMARDTSYEITEIASASTELIAPVVDCTMSDMVDGDTASSRFFYLTRQRQRPTNVSLVIISLSNQPYEIVAQNEHGPAGVATIQIIYDMRVPTVRTYYAVSIGYPFADLAFRAYDFLNTTTTGYWTLASIPADASEIVRLVRTASRDGFYIKAESQQSNVNVQQWAPDTDPLLCVARWRWVTQPVLHDAWAWVHAIQFFIGMSLLSNLVILCIATFRNLWAGKWWVGDAFVSISTSQLANGVAVIFSWFMNEYWVLHEFSFFIAFEVSGATQIYVDTSPLQAGMLTIYLSACGIIGHVFREKIDPIVAMVCYGIGFEFRVAIIQAIPALQDSIAAYASYSYMRGASQAVDSELPISPMRTWTTHPIGTRNYPFVAQCFFPIYSTLVLVIVYILVRKIHQRVYPEPLRYHSSTTTYAAEGSNSHSDETLLAAKRVLTLFEVATGAELENRYGLVSDYETCLFIKGMKFASADGIYSTGFVIVNQKFLLQTSDYWAIVIMKILRRRYRNIFVYDVNGSAVQQTARLVYPHTLHFHEDLAMVNVSVLS